VINLEHIVAEHTASHEAFLETVTQMLDATDQVVFNGLLEQARLQLASHIDEVDDATLAREIDYAVIELCNPPLYQRVVDHRLQVDLQYI